MNLSAYDDVMGLEFGDMDIEGLLDPEMLKEALVASTAGGAAILLTTYGVKKAATAIGLETKVTNPLLRSGLVSLVTLLGGVAIGRGLYDYNREAAIGVVGGLGGIAMASFLDTLVAQMTGNARLMPGLGEDDGSYDSDGTAALAMLEATNVSAAPGAFNGLADPTVTQEQLTGFESAMVEQETLGGYNAYMA
jgi:hypothetical protein